MKIFGLNTFINFNGVRQDKKTVRQLRETNPYDLNRPNRRKINKAIENLSEVSGEDNVKFLLDVSENLQYGTGIDLGKQAYNDWRLKLNTAAEHALSLSDESVKEKYTPLLQKAKRTREISEQEAAILENRELLLESVDFKQLENIKNKNIKNLKNNLDYFIISSEVTTAEKLYILKRLNYFMSDEYKINPQLKDKKTQVLAEILNDIVVNTPDSKTPNSKEINQLHHGMCASISICRKLLSYEDKANYVDMVLSELDDSENLMVYDIKKLGSHTKIPIKKIDIDFETALQRGYRIVDTSALYWMNVANTAGAYNDSVGTYNAFDKIFFDTFTDSHLLPDLSDELVDKQDYYRSLVKAKSAIKSYKAELEKRKFLQKQNNQYERDIFEIGSRSNNDIKHILKQIAPNLSKDEVNEIFGKLLNLEVKNSSKKSGIDENIQDFSYVSNEEDEVKLEKIRKFLEFELGENTNLKLLNKKLPEIFYLISELNDIQNISKSQKAKFSEARNLYQIAATYRTQQIMELCVNDYLTNYMKNFNLPNKETILINNLETLIDKIETGKINPIVKASLKNSFEIETDEELKEVLEESIDIVKTSITEILDNLYAHILIIDRKHSLATTLSRILNSINEINDKQELQELANDLDVNPDKEEISEVLNYYIDILQSKNCSEEEYQNIFNLFHKSHLEEFKNKFEEIGYLLFNNRDKNIIQAFNLLNGQKPDIPIEETFKLYQKIGESFNDMSRMLGGLQETLQIKDEKGNILNSADAKFLVLKELENMGEIATVEELTSFMQRFEKIDSIMSNLENGEVSYKDLPKELTSFSPTEKDILKKYRHNINVWYASVIRKLDDIYQEIKEPIEELNREIGVKTGHYWVAPEGNSGLYDEQQVKIIEHMTDRPYYSTEDIQDAIRIIKSSPYSGISSTSVDHEKPAMHAQYISDVTDITTANGETKEAIFYDNSWGPIEHENVWIDSDGLLRTDYAREYGGELGYITNEDYLNGNLVENVLNKNGEVKADRTPSKKFQKLNPHNEDYLFSLFPSAIVQGVYPYAMSSVRSLRQNLLISSYEYLDALGNYASEMTTDEIKRAISKENKTYKIVADTFSSIIEKIKGDKILYKGIDSQNKYDNLPNNDKTKILLEKAAIIKSFTNIPEISNIYKEYNSVKDLEKLRTSIKTEAYNNFMYTFGKHKDITKYISESSRKEIYQILNEFAQNNNLNFNQSKLTEIVNKSRKISNKDFDGSLEHTIDLMTQNIINDLKNNFSNIENQTEIYDSLYEKIKNVFTKNTKIKSVEEINLPNIENWIDNLFDPHSDEEFIEILNKMRNMTTKEFTNLYGSKIGEQDLGIKNISGYDIVKLLRAQNERSQNLLFNIIYMQENAKNTQMSQIKPEYDFNKYQRVLHGASYVGNKRTFDDIYTDYYYSLMSLTIGEKYNKFRQEAFKKYGVFPAYPKVEISTQESFEEAMQSIQDTIDYHMSFINAYKTQIRSMELLKNLKKNIKKAQNADLTNYQYKLIVTDLKELQKINENDETIEDTINLIQPVVESGTTSVGEYRELIEKIDRKLSKFNKIVDGLTIPEALKEAVKALNETKKNYIKSNFAPKYQTKAFKLFNKWIDAKAKSEQNPEDEIKEAEAQKQFENFVEYYQKHKLLRKPEKMLDEFLLLSAKDAKGKEENEDLIDLYKNSLRGLLYKSNLLELQYILMDCAEKGCLNAVSSAFRNSKIELRDGTTVDVDSEDGVNIIISPLLSEENLDTAAIFLNQIGLAERVINAVSSNTSFDTAYKNMKRRNNILSSADKQARYIRNEVRKLGDIDNDPQAIETIKNLLNNIIKYINKTNYRLTKEIYIESFNDIIEQIENQPELSKTAILSTNVEYAIQNATKVAMANVDLLSEELKRLAQIDELIEKLQISPDSAEYKKVEEFRGKMSDLAKYQNNFPSSYPNIGVQLAEN